MRILIVDDERIILDGIEYILKSHCPHYEIIGIVQSAIEGLQILENDNNINVVISDMKMPEMDGIEFIKRIKARNPDTEIVILSGYSDFEYVRHAMRNGAYDYLLKPCRYKNIIEVLGKIENKLAKINTDSRRNDRVNTLISAISGHEECNCEWSDYKNLQMVVIHTGEYNNSISEEKLLSKLSQSDINVESFYIAHMEHSIIVVFIVPIETRKLKDILYNYNQDMRKRGIYIFDAIHNFTYDSKCFEHAHRECCRMLEFAEFNDINDVMDFSIFQKYIKQQKDYSMIEYFSAQKISKHIWGQGIRNMWQYIDSGIEHFNQLGIYLDPIRFKKELLNELFVFERIVKDHGIEIDVIIGKKIDYIFELSRLGNLRHLFNWMKNLYTSVASSAETSTGMPAYIRDTMNYIETLYMEDLSLKDVSDKAYLNEWYFSTQFKRYTGHSFSEYHNIIRIKMSKELLKHKDLKVYQVAEMVGFQDATYFSTVFKNIENISPKEYQKL